MTRKDLVKYELINFIKRNLKSSIFLVEKSGPNSKKWKRWKSSNFIKTIKKIFRKFLFINIYQYGKGGKSGKF